MSKVGLRGLLNFKVINILIVSLFLILVAAQAGKSFILDELEFPIVSNATSQSGKPIYYHGEWEPHHQGTFHPTLYIHSLALFIKAFGFSENTVRAFGAICVLISAFLIIQIYRLLSDNKEPWLETLFLGLYLLNPYTLANATLPDIDQTVLPIALLLFIYAAIKFALARKLLENKSILILALLFALALWTKLTTPLILPIFLFWVAYISHKNILTSFVVTLKTSALGAAIFGATYYLYGLLLGISTTFTYSFLVHSFTKGTESKGTIAGALENIGYLNHFIFWPTVAIFILVGTASLVVLLMKEKDERARIKKTLILMALLTTFFYLALIAPFGGFHKYGFPVFGLLLLSIIFMLEMFKKIKINWVYVIVALLFGTVLAKLLKDSMYFSGVTFSYMWTLPILVVVMYVALRIKNTKIYAQNILVFIIAFALGFQLYISRVQAVAPYPTKYLYGQLGIDEAASYLRANTEKDEVIWGMKDIGYYTNKRWVESYGYYFEPKLHKDLIDKLQKGEIRYFVATTGIGQDNLDYYGEIRDILETYATKEKQFDNYVIYKAKGK